MFYSKELYLNNTIETLIQVLEDQLPTETASSLPSVTFYGRTFVYIPLIDNEEEILKRILCVTVVIIGTLYIIPGILFYQNGVYPQAFRWTVELLLGVTLQARIPANAKALTPDNLGNKWLLEKINFATIRYMSYQDPSQMCLAFVNKAMQEQRAEQLAQLFPERKVTPQNLHSIRIEEIAVLDAPSFFSIIDLLTEQQVLELTNLTKNTSRLDGLKRFHPRFSQHKQPTSPPSSSIPQEYSQVTTSLSQQEGPTAGELLSLSDAGNKS